MPSSSIKLFIRENYVLRVVQSNVLIKKNRGKKKKRKEKSWHAVKARDHLGIVFNKVVLLPCIFMSLLFIPILMGSISSCFLDACLHSRCHSVC